MSDEPKRVFVSYWPLFDYSQIAAGKFFDQNDLKFPDPPTVDGCLWCVTDDSKASPIFILDDAKAIAEHMTAWAQGDINNWFEFVIADFNGKYVAALIPNIQKSIERWTKNYEIVNGEKCNVSNLEVLFVPLVFGSDVSETYQNIINDNLIEAPVSVKLLDKKHFNPNSPFNTPKNKIIDLGVFNLANPSVDLENWVRGYCSNLSEPNPNMLSQTNPAFRKRSKLSHPKNRNRRPKRGRKRF